MNYTQETPHYHRSITRALHALIAISPRVKAKFAISSLKQPVVKWLLTTGLILLSCSLKAQLSDDFSDGDFAINPVWGGDVTEFVINSEQLNSNGPATTSVLHLSTSSTAIDRAAWEFLVDLQFAPSASNRIQVYVVSDQSDLENDLNGYYIEIGQSGDDLIKFYKQVGSTRTLLFTGSTLFTSSVLVRIKIERDGLGNWSVLTDVLGGFDYQSEGESFLDDSIISSSFFGVVCFHTATRNRGFFFDDFVISVVPEGLSLSDLLVESETTVRLLFSEDVDQASAEDIATYSIDQGIEIIDAVQDVANNNEVLLTISILATTEYELIIENIKDMATQTPIETPISVTFDYTQLILEELVVSSDHEIMLLFNGQLDQESVEDMTKYSINKDIGNPSSAIISAENSKAILLNFDMSFIPLTNYTLVFHDIENSLGNSRIEVSSEIVFEYVIPLKVDSIVVVTKRELSLYFNLELNQASAVVVSNYEIVPESFVTISAEMDAENMKQVRLNLGNDLQVENYTITINNVLDAFDHPVATDYTIEFDYLPLEVVEVSLVSTNEILVIFNQFVDHEVAEDNSNYSLGDEIGMAMTAMVDDENESTVHLTFSESFVNNDYLLKISNAKNKAGNSILVDFTINVACKFPSNFGDLVVNEIYADPTPSNGLPEIEYVELINISSKSINIHGFILTGATIGDVTVPPNQQVILTTSSGQSIYQSYGQAVAVSSWNILTNSGEAIVLYDNFGNIIDSLTYQLSWYHDAEKSNGGYSLERINPTIDCYDLDNWTASTSTQGGTPGIQNSVFDDSPDVKNPNLIGFDAVDELTFELTFDESMSNESLLNASYIIDYGFDVDSLSIVDISMKSIQLFTKSELQSGVEYTVNVDNLTDCAGNLLGVNSMSFDFDNQPPQLIEIKALSENRISLQFDEPLNHAAAVLKSNYLVDHNFSNPNLIELDTIENARLSLRFGSKFKGDTVYTMTISNIVDINGNTLSFPIEQTFGYIDPIDTIVVIDVNHLLIYFKQVTEIASATNIENYLLKDSNVHPMTAKYNSDDHRVIELAFESEFKSIETLKINQINDEVNNPLFVEYESAFNYLKLTISQVEVRSRNEISVIFNQSIDTTFAKYLELYDLGEELGAIQSIELDDQNDSVIHISIENEMGNSKYTLSVTSMKNKSGNSFVENLNFNFKAAFSTGFRDLVINEIYFDPTPSHGLPEVEYVELYNRTTNSINILGFQLSGGTIGDLTIPPNEYTILTYKFDISTFENYGLVTGVANWNALNNSGDLVLLKDNFGNIVDSVQYETTWYGNEAMTDGGFSLEQINPNIICNFYGNWQGSANELGGSPGKPNSIFSSDLDTIEPKITFIDIVDPQKIAIEFSEPLSLESIQNGTFILNNDVLPSHLEFKDETNMSMSLFWEQEFISNQTYTIKIGNVSDCAGNLILESEKSIYYDILPPKLERLVNFSKNQVELVFNESLKKIDAEKEANYKINGLIVPKLAVLETSDSSKVLLTFDFNFVEENQYQLSVSNLEDNYGNTLPSPIILDFLYRQDIDSMVVISSNLLKVFFKSELNNAALLHENYQIDSGIGSPISSFFDSENKSVLNLVFQQNIKENKPLLFSASHILNSKNEDMSTPKYEFIYDTAPPKLDSSFVQNATEIVLIFNKNLNRNMAETRENYEFDDSYPSSAQLNVDQKSVLLKFQDDFVQEKPFELEIVRLSDLLGNTLTSKLKIPFLFDLTPPKLDSVFVFSSKEIFLHFHEKVDRVSAEWVTNFELNDQNPISATLDSEFENQVILLFESELPTDQLNLKISGIADHQNNILKKSIQIALDHTNFRISSISTYSVHQLKLVFNEPFALAEFDNTENYTINGIQIPAMIDRHDREITLTYDQALKDHTKYRLTTNKILGLDLNDYWFEFNSQFKYAKIVGGQSIIVNFETEISNQLGIANFSINTENAHLQSVIRNSTKLSEIQLVFDQSLSSDVEYELNWHDIQNVFGNHIPNYSTYIVIDKTPPNVVKYQLIGNHTIKIFFNEQLAELSTLLLGNYQLNQNEGIPVSVQYQSQDSTLLMAFRDDFKEGLEYQLTLNNLQDLFGNRADEMFVTFGYVAPYSPVFGDLIVSEIMCSPNDDQSEFVEIYNLSDQQIDLTGLIWKDGLSETTIISGQLNPKTFLILTANGASALYQEINVGKVIKWLTLQNGGEMLSLWNGEQLIFTTTYSDVWYKSKDKSGGGYSLEMVDLTNFCGEEKNWTASNTIGGSPGKINTVATSNPDHMGPKLIDAHASNEIQVSIVFDEKLYPDDHWQNQIHIEPKLEIENLVFSTLAFDQAYISLTTPIEANKIYQLTIDQLTDCVGNVSMTQEPIEIVLPVEADSLDIVINEILFNPRSGGVDFVEIYNRSNKMINLQGWYLGKHLNDLKTLTNKHFILKPNAYLVLTSDKAILAADYPNGDLTRYFEMNAFPSFNDDEDSVILTNSVRNAIDFFEYSEDYHLSLIADVEGVSLERLGFDIPSNDSESWQSAASTVGYATPGLINSQILNELAPNGTLSIEPKVFVPDGNGQNDYTTINYQLKNSGSVANIKVFNTLGKSVKSLAVNKLLATEGFLTWDGTTDSGNLADVGYYIVYFEVFDASGNKSAFKETVVLGIKF